MLQVGMHKTPKKSFMNEAVRKKSVVEELREAELHPLHVASMSEMVSMRLVSENSAELVKTSKERLMRVYPSPARTDSSNQNPFDVWSWGGQLAPLNYQSVGLVMDLVTGFFARNGACGYVLKPLVYREPLSFFDPGRFQPDTSLPDTLPQILRLRVISAQQLPKPRGSAVKGDIVEPYVVLEVFGIPVDCAEERTKTLKGISVSGPGAVFDETFEFHVQLGSLAVVRFLILDDEGIGDDFIGQSCVPFDCLRPGYRHIRLRNDLGEPIPLATLFVHVSIQTGGQAAEMSRPGRVMSKLRTRYKHRPQLRKVYCPDLQMKLKTTGQQLLSDCYDTRTAVYSAFDTFRNHCGENPGTQSMLQCLRALVAKLISTTGSSEALAWPIKMRIRTEDALPHLEWCPPSLDALNDDADLRSLSYRSRSQSSRLQNSARTDDAGSLDSVSISNWTPDPPSSGFGLTRRLSMLSLTSAISNSSMNLALTPAARMDRLKRVILEFENFVEAAKTVIKRGPYMRDKLLELKREACASFYGQKSTPCKSGDGFMTRWKTNTQELAVGGGRKLGRSASLKEPQQSDNFAWNMRLISGQIQLLDACMHEVNTWLVQAREAGHATGLLGQVVKTLEPQSPPEVEFVPRRKESVLKVVPCRKNSILKQTVEEKPSAVSSKHMLAYETTARARQSATNDSHNRTIAYSPLQRHNII
ncbi:Inactive phospholipase C-like protein 2 [Cichlidogyrus casuarinus]|uniref:Phosphoinositide phospholipase C n=1 Tax=Cichlidogyrus casuarinus TaxID=1844966 RepID=A0ABD2PUT1_9PLAT